MKQFKDYHYERVNYEEFKKEAFEYLEGFKNAENEEVALQMLQKIHKQEKHLLSMTQMCSIRFSINTQDEFYKKEQEYWDEYSPLFGEISNEISKAVLDSKYLSFLKTKFPKTYFMGMEYSLKTFSSEIIEDLQKENKLSSDYSALIASAQIEFEGKTLTIPQMALYTSDSNRETRKKANEAVNQFFEENEDKFDTIYDELVKVRTKMAHKLGFKDYVEMGYYTMCRFDYNRDDVKIYREEILKHVVPLNQKLYEKQAKRIGVDHLHYYDLGLKFLDGNATPKGSVSEILEHGRKMYHELSDETKEFIDFMMDHNLFDVESKKGKQAGGYCTYIPSEQSPFIFANFNGTSHDVDVLTHEAGHAFQVYSSRYIEPTSCMWPTFETCEIHSMSMEFFTWPWMEGFFKDETKKYKYAHLSGASLFLPYGVLVDHFQHEVYENPDMTKEQRKQVWAKLEQMYCPERDYSESEVMKRGCFWYRQGHIFGAPFYYIDYTLAQICALQFWNRMMNNDPKAWEDYLAICKVGGTKTFLEVVSLANLKSPFEKNALKDTMDKVESYLEKLSEEL